MGMDQSYVRDKKLLRLIGDYLRAPLRQPDGSQQKRHRGTPQGGPLSSLLANIYLDPLDKELEQRGLAFVRYADDIAMRKCFWQRWKTPRGRRNALKRLGVKGRALLTIPK